MSMADMTDERLVSFGLDVTNKEDAIRKICKMMYDAGKVSSYEDYLQGVKDRELEFETGMGNGIAIPHCKGGCVKEAAFTLVKLNQKIEWGSLDGEPVDYVIMLAAPNTADNVGGLVGALIAGWFVLQMKKIKVPKALQGIMPIMFIPVLSTLIVGLLMWYVIGVPIAWLMGIVTGWLTALSAGSRFVLGAVIGAMIAFDNGGPVNKTAALFVNGLNADGFFIPTSAKMCAGMTSPLGIAISTVLPWSRNKFTKTEKEQALSLVILSCCYVQEGVIPFQLKDPVRLTASICVGGAITGGLCMMFGELGEDGSVNSTKMGTRCTGAGGFIDITQNAKKIVFLGTFTASGAKYEFKDGKLNILQEGKIRKMVRNVAQLSFNGPMARKKGQEVMIVTERAVFELCKEGVKLIEIAPGIDLHTQILDMMDFKPIISEELREMDASLFIQNGPFGLQLKEK